ncbi:MAG: four helix bundle protein [Lentimicrobium sp.]
MYTSFTEMPVWQKAHQLSIEIFNITSTLPRSEDYGLTSQIRRSSNSISGNIAEGFGRSTKKDKANFYIIARGSSYETQNHLLYGQEVGYFDEQITEKLFRDYSDLAYELNKIINAFTR